MKMNMGLSDRIIRIILAIFLTSLCVLNYVTGALAVIIIILAGLLLITSLFKFCPLYVPFGISTKREVEPEA